MWNAGDGVYLTDEVDAWVEGTVTSIGAGAEAGTLRARRSKDGREVTASTSTALKATELKTHGKGKATIMVLPRQLDLVADDGYENMDDMVHFHEAAILANIKRRFARDLIYTRTGPILIALNPFKWLDLYSDKTVARYHKAATNVLPAHCYAVGEDAYQSMCRPNGQDQSLVICGESGAGKTETTKLILQYLSRVSSQKKRLSIGGGEEKSARSINMSIEKRIQESNPVMEAFGNAKTLRNNNSSRFGKVRVCVRRRATKETGVGGGGRGGAVCGGGAE
jgi:myosin heavy subunit